MNDMSFSLPLDSLVERIEAEHAAVGAALRGALAHAIACGERLIEAKRQVKHGEWLPWIEARCKVPARTASHYMALARRKKLLTDHNGNVLPISVREAVGQLHHSQDCGKINGSDGSAGSFDGWGGLPCGAPFVDALQAVTRIAQCPPPAPRYVVKAAREGKAPGLTAAVLREAIALLTRYAEALERFETEAAAPPDLVAERAAETLRDHAVASVAVAHQRVIRERKMAEEPRTPATSLDGYTVEPISRTAALPIITEYEWLKTMGQASIYVGLLSPARELEGVVCFGEGPQADTRKVVGDRALCPERGACVHYAPPNAASFLITGACKLVHRQTGTTIFYAYADCEWRSNSPHL